MSKKARARIDNWTRIKGHTSDVLIGNVSGHIRQDEFHAVFQRTSQIVRFSPEINECETLNTIYTLGKKA